MNAADRDEQTRKDKEQLTEKFDEIQKTIAAIDGISTGDAILLGQKIEEYARMRESIAARNTMAPILDVMITSLEKKVLKPNDNEPWRNNG